METLEILEITNPTSQDFTWRYNGEPYTIHSKETKGFAKPVAFHLAKHLSTHMIVEETSAKVTKKETENPHAAVHVKIAQLSTYDTHERRIALYKIFANEDLVVQTLQRYPFKGFIGDMELYKAFVTKPAPVKKAASPLKEEEAEKESE